MTKDEKKGASRQTTSARQTRLILGEGMRNRKAKPKKSRGKSILVTKSEKNAEKRKEVEGVRSGSWHETEKKP